MSGGEHQVVDAHGLCQSVERVALNDFGTSVCKESFALAREMPEDNIADNSVKNGVAEELQSFVVDFLSFRVAVGDALVHQCHLIITNVVRKNSQYLV